MTVTKVDETVPFLEGPHVLPEAETFDVELPRGTSQFKRIFDRIFNQFRRVLTNGPDYDSGYFKVLVGDNTYLMNHGIGSVPRRHIIYGKADPISTRTARDYVQIITPREIWEGYDGLSLNHQFNGQRSFIRTRTRYLWWNIEEAWIRVMLWR